MRIIESAATFQQEISSSGIKIAVFEAGWCPDCARIKPFMPQLEEEHKEQMDFLSVDFDRFKQDLVREYDISGIPSFVAFKEGKVIDRFVSPYGKSRQEIEAFLAGVAGA